MMIPPSFQLIFQYIALFLTMMIANISNRPYVSGAAFRNLNPTSFRRDTGLQDSGVNESPHMHSVRTYDQRQNGKYNIHLNIKDVKIIAVGKENLDGNFGDDTVYDYGDYDYDPAHLTVSPLPIFGSGISAVSITSTSKPHKSTSMAPISSTTVNPPIIDNSKTSTAFPIHTTSPKGSIGITLAETTPLTHEPSEHLKPEVSPPTITSFPNISSNATSSSNIIKIKPATAAVQHDDYQKIPVKVIIEPILSQKYRNSIHPTINTNQSVSFGQNVAITSSHQPQQRSMITCPEGEFYDQEGKCRAQRSGILKLFFLLSNSKD